MNDSLNFLLRGTGISNWAAQSCGVTAGPEGFILPSGAPGPSVEPSHEPAAAEPAPGAKPAPAPAPPRENGSVLESSNDTPPSRGGPVPLPRPHPVPIPRPRPVPHAPAPAPSPEPAPHGSAFTVQYRPNWEARTSEGKRFTAATLAALDKYGQSLLNTRRLADANKFCPRYSSLSPTERKEFWLHMMSAIAQPESANRLVYRPFDERAHGNVASSTRIRAGMDQRYSMGLFALSYDYGHMRAYLPACAGINKRADHGKTVMDPSLTMSSLKVQTECAVGIMNFYVRRHGEIGYNRCPATSACGRHDPFSPAWSTVMYYNSATRRVTIPALHRFKPCWGGN
jgi:hypothetical protein